MLNICLDSLFCLYLHCLSFLVTSNKLIQTVCEMCTVIPSLFFKQHIYFQPELVRKQSTCSFSLHFLSINSLLLIIFFIPFPHKDMHVLPPEEKLSVLVDHSENRHALRKDQLTVYWLKKTLYSYYHASGLKQNQCYLIYSSRQVRIQKQGDLGAQNLWDSVSQKWM